MLGTFARVASIALNAVLAADVRLGEQVAIFGQGVIGLLATRLATLSGGRVLAVDTQPGRLEIARAFGADDVVDALRPGGAGELIRELTGGGADSAIELSGTRPRAARGGALGRRRGPRRGIRLLSGRRVEPAPRRGVPSQPRAHRREPDLRRARRASAGGGISRGSCAP